jgi:hypothetical protein
VQSITTAELCADTGLRLVAAVFTMMVYLIVDLHFAIDLRVSARAS